ncbi:MAG: flagellar basal body P-ring formation chaperone FlgA [Planctomycetota bacterium]|jgi:flagella basal body P-ring formation protein FlgA
MSKSTLTLLAVLALATSSAVPAGAAGDAVRIALKERAAVSGESIALQDVAQLGEGAPLEVASLPLANAPWPGQSRRVTRVLIKARLMASGHDLRGFEFVGTEDCIVESRAIRVEPEQLVDAARRHLREQFPEGGPEVRIELLQGATPVLLSARGGPVALRPLLAGTGSPTGTVRVYVELLRDGTRIKRVPLSFQVRVSDRVAVAARRIGPGEALSELNVRFLPRDVTAVSGICVRSRAELAGKVAARAIRPGQVVTRRMVEEAEQPLVIDLHQRVFLVAETETLRAVTVGKSLCRARLGEVARASNLVTGREVVGIAVAGSTIKVVMEGSSDDS